VDWNLITFSASLLTCVGVGYLIIQLQSGDTRDRGLKSFFVLCVALLSWILFNAIPMVISSKYFGLAYSVKLASIPPAIFATLWCFLHFTESKLINSRIAKILLIIIPALDSLAMLTNSWHKLVYSNMHAPSASWGWLFMVHLGINTLIIIMSYSIIFNHYLKNFRQNPYILIVVIGAPIPYVFNMLYSFTSFNIDITPLGYTIVVASFAYVSYKSRLFHFKAAVLNRMFDAFKNTVIFIINKDGYIVDINSANNYYFPAFAPAIGKTTLHELLQYFKLYMESSNPQNLLELIDHTKTESTDGEVRFRMDNGNIWSFKLTWLVTHKRGKATNYVLSLYDVTELIESKAIAESASRAKSAFLSNMSHEIRTPMNAIIGMTIIGKSADSIERKDYAIEKIGDASIHLLGIVNDILDMSKIEADKLELSPVAFNFEAMLDTAASFMKLQLAEKNQKFSLHIDDRIPKTIKCDKQLLSQVIMNLLSNAVKFTPKKGEISLNAELVNDENGLIDIRFNIKDTGIGISKKQQARLFIPFEQAESSTTRKFGGTGLGLAISKRIVELMGGGIAVTSELDKGTTFSFTIRAAVPDDDIDGALIDNGQKDESDAVKNFEGYRVLLAEDVELNREIMLALLESTKLEIDFAKNGVEAVQLFCKAPDKYNLILMDIQMPEMDGYEATKRIRTFDHPLAKTVPIIAITANVFKEDVEKCLEAGMNDHVGKPVDFDEVVGKLREYLC